MVLENVSQNDKIKQVASYQYHELNWSTCYGYLQVYKGSCQGS